MRRCLSLVALGLIAASPAAALDLPTRKAGLWEMKTAVEGRGSATHTVQQCVDAATDKQMGAIGANAGPSACSKQDVKKG